MNATAGSRATAVPAWTTPAAVALACVALAARPVAWRVSLTMTLILAIGVLAPVATTVRMGRARWLGATALGVAGFAVARALDGPVGIPFVTTAVLANTLAAIAEEALFRRAAYGCVERRHGPLPSIVVTAAVFGLVHVPLYGWGAVPIDAAAGLVLGWQRWATGSWSSPAVTHAVANLLMVG